MNELKTTDVRRGNLVMVHDNMIMYVYHILADYGFELSTYYNGQDDLDYGVGEVFGIPLTEERLIELGFVDDDGDFLIDVDDRTCIHINLNRKRTLLESYDGIITLKMVDYVHQVQNLYFALKREELK